MADSAYDMLHIHLSERLSCVLHCIQYFEGVSTTGYTVAKSHGASVTVLFVSVLSFLLPHSHCLSYLLAAAAARREMWGA